MTLKKLIMHIGIEKTATTSIQDFVYLNRQELSERGITLCDSLGIPNNQKLVACFQNHVDDYLMDHGIVDLKAKEEFFHGFLETFRNEIEKKIPEGGTILITSELFHSRLRDQESIDKLRDFLTSVFDEITIVCYLREQSSLASSFYSTRIKAGSTDSLEDFVNGISAENHYYNYKIFLDKWSRAFGADNLAIRIFDRSKLRNSNIFDDFLGTIKSNLDTRGLRELPRQSNETLGSVGIEIGRKINSIYPRYNENGSVNHFRWELMNCLSGSRLGAAGAIWNPKAQEIYDMFCASNAEVARNYLALDTPLFGRPPKRMEERRVFDNDQKLIDMISEFFESLFGTVVQDRVLPREQGMRLRSATDRLLQLPAILSAAEEILQVAQVINPEGQLIRERLETLKALKTITNGN